MNNAAIVRRAPGALALCLFLLLAGAPAILVGQVMTNVLVPAGSMWRFLDDGSDQGTAWRAPEFDDTAWPCGFAELGFGDFDEETVLYAGPTGNQYITYYFRLAFDLTGASSYTSLNLGVLRDDGVIVYLNGASLWRNNMPAGLIGYRTLASTNVSGAAEDTFYSADLAPTALRNGINVLAVEVHQSSRTSSDLSFDLQLTGISVPPRVTRGPYLQKGNTTNVVVRWRTSVPADSQVRFGTVAAALNRVAFDPFVTTEHEVLLADLSPNTLYYYSISTSEQALAGDSSYYFVTAPAGPKPTRLWVIGDSGTANFNARAVYDAYRNFNGARYTDLWLMLGDNAYGIGTDQEYQNAVFNMYPELLRQTVLWSTIGNHETYSGTFADFPFLHIFTQPQNGECGGVASGTERYYAFDYGNIHFVCLDAMTSDRSVDGPMCTWLQEDLEATTNDWVIAFWHHPPYTHGSHNSDFEIELVQMRENVVPILESFGVDLVLCGHSHCYERSFLIDGHYGVSSTFTEEMKKDGGSGREDDTGPYLKAALGPGTKQGAVYIVAGCAGQISGGSLDYPAMFLSENRLGSLVLDINGLTLQAKFLRETGVIDDYFTMLKGSAGGPLRLVSYEIRGGLITLYWNTRVGKSYVLERATRLNPSDWTEVIGGLPGDGNLMSWTVPLSTSSAFFRVYGFDD
jgi:hypothetical protein